MGVKKSGASAKVGGKVGGYGGEVGHVNPFIVRPAATLWNCACFLVKNDNKPTHVTLFHSY